MTSPFSLPRVRNWPHSGLQVCGEQDVCLSRSGGLLGQACARLLVVSAGRGELEQGGAGAVGRWSSGEMEWGDAEQGGDGAGGCGAAGRLEGWWH